MKAVLRMVMRGGVRVDGVVWTSPALAGREGAVVALRLEAGAVVAVLDGAACPLTRMEG